MREEEACVWAAKLTIIVRWCGAWLSLPPLAPPGADHQIHHHSSPPRRHWGLSRMPSAANDGDRSPGSKRSPALVHLQPPVIRNRLCSQRRRYTFARGLFCCHGANSATSKRSAFGGVTRCNAEGWLSARVMYSASLRGHSSVAAEAGKISKAHAVHAERLGVPHRHASERPGQGQSSRISARQPSSRQVNKARPVCPMS